MIQRRVHFLTSAIVSEHFFSIILLYCTKKSLACKWFLFLTCLSTNTISKTLTSLWKGMLFHFLCVYIFMPKDEASLNIYVVIQLYISSDTLTEYLESHFWTFFQKSYLVSKWKNKSKAVKNVNMKKTKSSPRLFDHVAINKNVHVQYSSLTWWPWNASVHLLNNDSHSCVCYNLVSRETYC
jgi:hypothetical protein